MFIVLAILAFGVLIITHELGHFLLAKLCRVKVNEFSVGMGPLLLKKTKGETQYSLRALPIGGFCAMEGEDDGSENPDPRAFGARPVWQRALILCAGSAVNFLIGVILVFSITPLANFSEPVIYGFMENCPYEGENGFLEGDLIRSVDGHRTYISSNVGEYLQLTGSNTHRIVLQRAGRRVVLDNYEMTMREYPASGGGTVLKYGLYFAPREYGFFANLRYAHLVSFDFARVVWRSLGDLICGAVSVREVSGPVGIVSYVNEVATSEETVQDGLFDFIYIFALIAVNLAVMNMLPIPALDGGRLFFLLVTFCIERITKKKLDPKYEGWINTACLILLMAFMVFVMFSDVLKIILK